MPQVLSYNGQILTTSGEFYKVDTSDFDNRYVEVDTEAEMDSKLVSANLGKVYKYVGTSGKYTAGRLYTVEDRPSNIPLTFTANTAGSTVALNKVGNPAWTGSYSTDGSTWTTYVPSTTGAITLANVGDKVYFKGDITGDFDLSNYLQFCMTGSIAASGNCNSMYINSGFDNLTTLMYSYCYYMMFYACTSLTAAPELPATTLAYMCYERMFMDCTSLIVSDTQIAQISHALTIPTSGTFTNTYSQGHMFESCAGTRSSDDMAGAQGQSYTYYTQNQPV